MTENDDKADDRPATRVCDVVIATRNRPEPLARCLRSLAAQTANDFGIIVVDDHSDTPLDAVVDEVASSVSFPHPPLLLRLPRRSGPAAGRNAGVAASTAEYVIFIDDDIVLDRHAVDIHLSEVAASADSSAPIVSHGPFVEPPDWRPTPWNKWEAHMATRGSNAIVRGDYEPTWRNYHTGNNCLPTAVFRAVGGFDESFLRAEDDEFGARLMLYGCRFHFVPSALAWHYSNRSLQAWLDIPIAYAYYTVVIDEMYPEFGYLELRHYELRESHAVLRIARVLARGRRRTRFAVGVAVGAARVAYRLGLGRISLGALSIAYDLSFVDGLRLAEAGLIAEDLTIRSEAA